MLSISSSGNARNRRIRVAISLNTYSKCLDFSASEPSKVVGSSNPQWAVSGCPSHTGQFSPLTVQVSPNAPQHPPRKRWRSLLPLTSTAILRSIA
jgi:hypothetical protein